MGDKLEDILQYLQDHATNVSVYTFMSGATGDYHTLLTSKATAIAKALSAPLQSCPNVFVPGEDEHKADRSDGYDFGFLHVKAIDDAGHDKAIIFKVKALEAVDRAMGQLARLLWESESMGNFEYFLCVTGDHFTPVEYGDHSFEPVPDTVCPLKDFVDAVGVETILGGSLDAFPFPTVKDGKHLADDMKIEQGGRSKQPRTFSGDSVYEFNEIAAARGCLGRFPGGEMMGVTKNFLKLDA